MNKLNKFKEIVRNNYPSSKEIFDEGVYNILYTTFIKGNYKEINSLPEDAIRLGKLKDYFMFERGSSYSEDKGVRVDLFVKDDNIYLRDRSYHFLSKNHEISIDEDKMKVFEESIDDFLNNFNG